MQPSLLTDPNSNRSEVAFDTLEMVVGTAIMGKALLAPVQGDSLAGFNADLDEATLLAHLENPLVDPHAIVQRATTRLVYDLFAYARTKEQPDPQPAVVYALVRETHEADLIAGAKPRSNILSPILMVSAGRYRRRFRRSPDHLSKAVRR